MRKIPRKPKKKSPRRAAFASFLNDRASLYTLGILVLATGLAIGFRIFKAVKTGIIYDEVYSLFNFGTSYHNALTLYKNPNNNHVINHQSENITFGRWYKEDFYDSFQCKIGFNPNIVQKYNLTKQQ